MRSLFGVVLAAILAVATASPVVADAGVINSRFVTATWGSPASPVGSYNPDVQFHAGGRTGTPDYEGNVGVQSSVGFSWTRTHCDTATNTLVTVALYGPPAGWAYVDPARWNSSPDWRPGRGHSGLAACDHVPTELQPLGDRHADRRGSWTRDARR